MMIPPIDTIPSIGNRTINADFCLRYRGVSVILFIMSEQTLEGQVVTVNTLHGPTARVVVFDLGKVVVVATPDSYDRVRKAGLGPFSIGFPREDIVLDGMAPLKHNIQYEQAEHG
jgi:hypothetical protein